MGRKNISLIVAFGVLLGSSSGLNAGELELIVVPRKLIVPATGHITFDAYLFNNSSKEVSAGSPQGSYKMVWASTDVSNRRPKREDTDHIIGTHTIRDYKLKPGGAAKTTVATTVDTQPGDLFEFHIILEPKTGTGSVIRSNSVLLYRPQ